MKNITDQAVTMSGHCDKIDIFLARELDDLVRWFAKRKHSVAGETFSRQLAAAFSQVGTVLFHLLAFCELKLIEISLHPAAGNADDEQPRAGHTRKRFDVSEHGRIVRTHFERC